MLSFKHLFGAFIVVWITLAILSNAQAQGIMPIEPPQIQNKAVHILTANERSEILIYDIWKPVDIDRVKIGKGAALGIVKKNNVPTEPYGWQAFVSQDARGSRRGGYEAVAYGGL